MPMVRELNNSKPLLIVLDDFMKSAALMFCNEVLIKCLADYDRDEKLFDFLENSLHNLNKPEKNTDFHLQFLLELSLHLGFYPGGLYEVDGTYFDLVEGHFTKELPGHRHCLEGPDAALLHTLMSRMNGMTTEALRNSERQRLLSILLDYYRIHIDGFNEMKSREVLETIMR